MGSRSYFINLVFGVILIALTGIFAGLMFSIFHNNLIAFLLVVLCFIECVVFIGYLNTINRKIGSFFNSIQNYETAIQAVKPESNKSLMEIQNGLTQVIEAFQKTKIEGEIREQLLMAMIEHSSTGFLSIDDNGDFEIMNQTSRDLLDVSYTSNLDRLKAEMPELFKILSELQPGQSDSCQLMNSKGIQVVKVSVSELKFKEKRLKLVSIQDIKNEVETRELQSWQKLIRIMNHEIMNSIAPITSVSKSLLPIFLKDGDPVDPKNLDQQKVCDTISGLEVIESMSEGLNNFVGQYRKLSQIPQPKKTLVDGGRWLDAMTNICKSDIEKNRAQLKVASKTGNMEFEADEGLLNQVMLNLIKNAAEAPMQGEQQKVVQLELSVSLRDKTVIRVINNGDPIPEEVQDKIFVPFFTTKEEGSGIGLFLSRQIINLHKGSLSVYTNDLAETVFEVVL